MANLPGSGVPTGSVSFYDGTAILGTSTISGGVATFTAPKLSAGIHTIKVSYSGDNNFLLSTLAAATQTVLSAQQQAVLLINQVNTLTTGGVLSSGESNALTVKLNNAIASLNAGNKTAGINQLSAFINQVNALVNSHRLTAAQAQALIDAANQAIASAQA